MSCGATDAVALSPEMLDEIDPSRQETLEFKGGSAEILTKDQDGGDLGIPQEITDQLGETISIKIPEHGDTGCGWIQIDVDSLEIVECCFDGSPERDDTNVSCWIDHMESVCVVTSLKLHLVSSLGQMEERRDAPPIPEKLSSVDGAIIRIDCLLTGYWIRNGDSGTDDVGLKYSTNDFLDGTDDKLTHDDFSDVLQDVRER